MLEHIWGKGIRPGTTNKGARARQQRQSKHNKTQNVEIHLVLQTKLQNGKELGGSPGPRHRAKTAPQSYYLYNGMKNTEPLYESHVMERGRAATH